MSGAGESSNNNRLDPPVNGRPDHTLGDPNAPITLVEYGSYNCPSCRAADEIIADLRDRFGDRLRYVFRHRPISSDTTARRAAELAQYAYETTGEYWPAHAALMKRGPTLRSEDFDEVTAELGLPPADGPHRESWRRAQARVQEDMDNAWRSGARVSPTFFINNRRYEGPWDESALTEALLGSLGHRVQTAALDFAQWAPSTGLLRLTMIMAALLLTNSPAGPAFEALWEMPVGWIAGGAAFQLPLRDWFNDGLLTIFFSGCWAGNKARVDGGTFVHSACGRAAVGGGRWWHAVSSIRIPAAGAAGSACYRMGHSNDHRYSLRDRADCAVRPARAGGVADFSNRRSGRR